MRQIFRGLAVSVFVIFFNCSKDEGPDNEIKESNAKQLLSFSFLVTNNNSLEVDAVGVINQNGKTVSLSVPDGTDVSRLTPSIAVSDKAEYSPGGPQDFSQPIDYLITAEDGSKASYEVSVEVQEPMASISEINPGSGPKGTIVTISGQNFGNDPNNIELFFNGVKANIESFSSTEIQSVIPPKALTGEVTLVINSQEIVGPVFTYEYTEAYVTTIAGSGEYGFLDGSADVAQFKAPTGLEVAPDGTVYIADAVNNRVRVLSTDGFITTLAGSTGGYSDGPGESALFRVPTDLALDMHGNLYVTDSENQRIRKISPDGVVSTVAGSTQGNNDGPGVSARFINPRGIYVDSEGTIFLTDSGNNRIRKISPDGIVSTLAGSIQGNMDGEGTAAKFDVPSSIYPEISGDFLVTDWRNHKVRKVTKDGAVSTFTGGIEGFADGELSNAQFNHPTGIVVDSQGTIFIADNENNRIRKIDLDGSVSTFAGGDAGFNDGPADLAQFHKPSGLAIDAEDNIYVADEINRRVRKITRE